MKFDEILSLSTIQQTTNSAHISQGDIEGVSTVVGKMLAGRAAVLFLIIALLFISILTKVRPIFIIFIVVILAGVFHQELFKIYLSVEGYFRP